MWTKKKETEDSKAEEPKVTTRSVIMEITVINNKTEKEYFYKSENSLGLDWLTIDGWLHILQLTSVTGEWNALAAVVDFSIVKCEWKTFDIV